MDEITIVEFALTKDVLNDYFANNPRSKECKNAIDYINTEKGCRPYILGSIYQDIIRRLGNGNVGVKAYIDSVINDGGRLTGTSTLGNEDKDILFLTGYLTQPKHIKKVFILTHHDAQFNKDIADSKHDDVLEKIDKEIGFRADLEIGIISPQTFNSIKEAI